MKITFSFFKVSPRSRKQKILQSPKLPLGYINPPYKPKKDNFDPIRHPPKISVLLIIESPHYIYIYYIYFAPSSDETAYRPTE